MMPNSVAHDASHEAPIPEDSAFHQEIARLHRLTVLGRWCVLAALWLTLGAWSLWQLRRPIALMADYFTWASLRYGLAFNLIPAIGLTICIGMTVSVLVWQSRNILLGFPTAYQHQLEEKVLKIRQQGQSHPLWKWVCRESSHPLNPSD